MEEKFEEKFEEKHVSLQSKFTISEMSAPGSFYTICVDTVAWAIHFYLALPGITYYSFFT